MPIEKSDSLYTCLFSPVATLVLILVHYTFTVLLLVEVSIHPIFSTLYLFISIIS